jgi:hypothetical protein
VRDRLVLTDRPVEDDAVLRVLTPRSSRAADPDGPMPVNTRPGSASPGGDRKPYHLAHDVGRGNLELQMKTRRPPLGRADLAHGDFERSNGAKKSVIPRNG